MSLSDLMALSNSRDQVARIANGGPAPSSNLLPHEAAARQEQQQGQQPQIASNPAFETRQMNDMERLFAGLGQFGNRLAE